MKVTAPTPLKGALIFVGLAVVFAAMIGVSFVPLGGFTLAANLACALLIGLGITFGFMGLGASARTLWLTAAAGSLWLLILFTLTFADYLTRGWLPG